MKLERVKENPLITPGKNWWEFFATFNPAAIIHENQVTLLYRALGGDGLSRFGLAKSLDGIKFERLNEPVFEGDVNNPLERLGVEDPRITRIGNLYYIVYNAPSVYPASTYKSENFAPSLSHPAPWRVRPCLLTTKDFQVFERKGVLLEEDTKDCLLFPEQTDGYFLMTHRRYPNLYLTFSKDLKNWEKEKLLISPRAGYWDSERVGAGAVPIKTPLGWLKIYHGTDKNHVYRLGVLILDEKDPSKVLFRSDEPILEPETLYEKVGVTPNVVFTCGAVEKDEKYLIYYGAADKVISLATIDKQTFLNSIKI